ETTPGDTNRCELFRNNGDGTFTECAAEVGLDAIAFIKAVASGDYNNDGWPDLYVASRGQPKMLFRNDGPQSPNRSAKGAWKFSDLDNDGYLDFYIGTGNPDLSTLIPNRMFRNAEGKFFQDVTTAGGFGHLQKGHGIAFADLDNDGDQDIFANMGGAYTGDVY